MNAFQIPRNSLAWMLAAQFLVVMPHVPRLPPWIIAIALACAAWRIGVYLGRWRFPPGWVKVIFVISGMVGVPLGHGTVLGLEPAVSLLIVAFFFKLVEMQQRRDAFLVVFLAYFVVSTEFLFEQSILMALFVLFAMVMVTGSLVGLNQSPRHTRPVHTARRALTLLSQAAPLMLVLFVLFPRISPLWTVPMQSPVGISGVTDRLEVGDIATLSQSDELAFRVVFEGQPPLNSELYWRGLALSRYDATSDAWTHEDRIVYGPRPIAYGRNPNVSWDALIERRGGAVNYSVVLEPTQQNFVFALATPLSSTAGIGLVRDYRLRSAEPIVKKLRYEVTSWLDHSVEREMSPEWQYRMTLLPENSNQRTLNLAREMRASVDSDKAYIREIAGLFQRQFVYTLKPGLLGDDPYDAFLLDTQRGFCEHFAGSFVYLMRAVGIPARVVVGYQGGEYNPRGNYVAVHQFDAHAWAEVWFPGDGWKRYDPTSWVAPERIELGLEAAISDENSFLEDSPLSWLRYRQTLWLTELRLQLSAVSHYWDTWVVGYTPTLQMKFLQGFIPDLSMTELGVLLLAGFFGVLALIAVGLLAIRPGRPLAPADREYLRYCALLARAGLARNRGEGPRSFAARVAERRPDLAANASAVANAYEQVSYAEDAIALVALRESVRAATVRVIAGTGQAASPRGQTE